MDGCPRTCTEAERSEGGLRIHLADDGRGLDLDALRDKAGGAVEGGDEQAAGERVPGGRLDGGQGEHHLGTRRRPRRGRSFVRERGGDVAIAFTGALNEGRRAFELVFTLPQDAVVTDEDGTRPVA